MYEKIILLQLSIASGWLWACLLHINVISLVAECHCHPSVRYEVEKQDIRLVQQI